MSDEHPLTKVHIDLPNHWAVGGESLSARHLGGDRYRLENVPFYAYDLNFADIVEAKASEPDRKPSILRVVARSGRQTIRVMFGDEVAEPDVLSRLHTLEGLGVTFERCSKRYFALDLEPGASIVGVRARLDEWAQEGVAEYETCEARVPGSFDADPADESAS